MVVSDVTILTVLAVMFIYLVVYRQNKFIGSVLFLGAGIASMWIDTTNILASYSIIIGSIVAILYSMFDKQPK